MKTQIKQIVEEYWVNRFPALMKLIGDATRQVENFLRLEDYYRGAQAEDERFQQSFGGFGSAALDMNALTSVLARSYESRTMEKARLQRMEKVHKQLVELRKRFGKQPPAPQFVESGKGPQAVLDAFETFIEPMTQVFRLTRIARLEARGRYDPAEHDAWFQEFDWRQLDNAEMSLCPPFVAYYIPEGDPGAYLGDLMHLLTAGRPVKLVLLQQSLYNGLAETGRAAALRGMVDVALMFLSLRNVYFLQSSVAADTPLSNAVAAAMASPRPAVVSVYTPGGAETSRERALPLAREALRSRAFPHFSYDPDRAADFVSCLDLSENPALEEVWPSATLAYVSDDGEPAELERPFTFADYAVDAPEFNGQFKPLTGEQEPQAVAIADYLALEPGARRDKVPFVYKVDADKRLTRLVPSQAVVAQTFDRMHLWHTLQELEGVKNPFVQAAEARVTEQLSAERDKAVADMKAQVEQQLAQQKEEAVSTAMRNLALRLTGMATGPAPQAAAAPQAGAQPAAAPAEGAPAAAPPPAAEAEEEEEAEVSETPWIDQRLCTTCDECVNINKAIFAYDGSKKAYIKDAKAGPYKDIVRAAEKCSSGAIHPGLPQNPDEKDVDKWIKRAEPFQ